MQWYHYLLLWIFVSVILSPILGRIIYVMMQDHTDSLD